MVATATPSTGDELRQRVATQLTSWQQTIRNIPAINSPDDLETDTAAAITQYEVNRGGLIGRSRDVPKPILDALVALDSDSPDVGAVTAAMDATKLDRNSTTEAALALAKRGASLAQEAAEELKPIARAAQEAYEKTLAEVKAWLTEGGQGVESTDAGVRGTNGAAAETQFDQLAKKNTRSRAAFVEASRLKNAVAQLVTTSYRCGECVEDLRKILHAEVVKAVSA